jgi:hypothetical protein
MFSIVDSSNGVVVADVAKGTLLLRSFAAVAAWGAFLRITMGCGTFACFRA